MAPELLSENHYTVAADMFSFGMVLSELLTHRIPYSDLVSRNGQPLVDTAIINMVINGTIRPTLPDDCPVWMRDLTLACIAADPSARPTALHAAMVLHAALARDADCKGLIAGVNTSPCTSPVVLHLQDNVTSSDIDAFCKDPSCLQLLDAYTALGTNCRACGLPELAGIDQFERWPQFSKVCAIPCKRQFKAFAHHFYSCFEYDQVELGTPGKDTCASCRQLNSTIRQTAFANDCGGNVTTMYNFVQVMTTNRTKGSASRDTSLLFRQCETLYAAAPALTSTPPVMAAAASSTALVVAGAVFGVLLTIGLFIARHPRGRSSPRSSTISVVSAESPLSDEDDLRLGFTSLRENMLALLPSETMAKLTTLSVHGKVDWAHSIAKGANGEVFMGTYAGEAVAIKALLPERCDVATDLFNMIDEILLLSQLSHPRIVRFLGVSFTTTQSLCFLVEYMDRGDLRDLLVQSTPQTYPQASKLESARSLAESLVYLHGLGIIHRDLKSRNVLVDSRAGTKLTDFGVARHVSCHNTMTVGVGTYRWMAPEVLSENQYTVAADIYSLGMVLSELNTHRIPYSDMKSRTGQPLVDTAIISMVVNGAIQPTLAPDVAPWMAELIMRCIATEAALRPSAQDVVAILRQHT
ncbi:protein kinase [Achlya hypogyna]|uniref:Protein kinase n=1 Tax=Achlya hypogyna TaxID=1202772 RepID=A0A1V9ZR42_ACHHY|nr:protein kinase [Achlya hypogyna]